MDETTIDRYLFNEMSDAEREKLEESVLDGDDEFYAIATRENELVDRYVNGSLTGDTLRRFEASLAENPARRQKIANGKALREFIVDERLETRTITIAERSGFFAAISDFLRMPALQFASIGVILVLALASVFLLMENRRLGSLEADLAAAQQREVELSTQIETAQEATGELTTDLNAERERIQELQTEIAKLKNSADDPTPGNRIKPTIATLLLLPAMTRGGPTLVQRLELPSGVERVSIVLTLDRSMPSGERASVKLNGEPIASNLAVRTRAGGEKIVSFAIPTTRINDTRNEIVVTDGSGNTLETYAFSVSRQK